MHSRKRRTSFRYSSEEVQHISILYNAVVFIIQMWRGLSTSSIPRLLCPRIKEILSEHEILLLGLSWLWKLAHLDSAIHDAVNAGIEKRCMLSSERCGRLYSSRFLITSCVSWSPAQHCLSQETVINIRRIFLICVTLRVKTSGSFCSTTQRNIPHDLSVHLKPSFRTLFHIEVYEST
jgi:hypothetical protein